MLLAARHLVDRLRHPRSRADDLDGLRRRLAAAEGPGEVSEEEREAAAAIARVRQELFNAFGPVEACRGCAKGHPLPHGRWSGGHCCGCRTEQVFTDDEVAVLKLTGTTTSKLTPPAGDHAGCVFRGPEGCSIDVADRPSICVRYVCRELEGELRARGDLKKIRGLGERLAKELGRFSRARTARRAGSTGA